MNTSGLQENLIFLLEKTEQIKETSKNVSERLCCEKCRFSTKDSVLFERHVAQHEEMTFLCTICNHISYSRVESQRHLVKHRGSFPYKCSWCSYGAVRRDYMVKHIQRIHGKSADGITKIMKAVEVQCMPVPRPLAGPSHAVKFVKPQPYIVTSSTHTDCNVTQGLVPSSYVISKEASPTVSKAMEYVNKKGNITFLENTTKTSSKQPRVHVGISGDRSLQQKLPLQSQVVGTTEKAESNTMPKMHIGHSVSNNNNHLRTLLSKQHKVPVTPSQKCVISGVVQNSPDILQWPAPSALNPTIPVEQIRQGIPATKPAARMAGKKKTRPNILRKTPFLAAKSNTKPVGDPTFLSSVSRPNPHDRPLMDRPRSNVQVELLAPLNQPIQHNKPLTVSCPEEINIPAGCLVELVEVKTVNGARELELRLVPQQLPGPQIRNSNSTSTESRLTFKCTVTTDDDNQPVNLNQEICSAKANAVSEHLDQQCYLKKLLEVNVKKENDVKEKAICSKKNGPPMASEFSINLFQDGSSSVASNPLQSHKIMQQLCAKQKNVASKPVTICENISLRASNQNSTTESYKYKLTAAQPPTNKQEDAELGYQGLPVISSVFSLCPISQNTHNIDTKKDGQVSVPSGSKENLNNSGNPRVCRRSVKTEQETRLLTDCVQNANQPATEKDIFEEPKATKIKTYAKDKEEVIVPQLCTDAATNTNNSFVNKSDMLTQPENTDRRKLESMEGLSTQTDSPLALHMNPRVTLMRMPTLDCSSLLELANKEKTFGEESISARPVVCCTSNLRNSNERTIKLVLKRKRFDTVQDDGMNLMCVDIPPTNKKMKKDKKRVQKQATINQQLLRKDVIGEIRLMPLKDDQLVKCPGPNQPVVVLNHPNPLVQTVSMEGQTFNNLLCQNLTSGICNQEGTILSNPARTCPSVKMTLKKVQGQMYQVTELLLKGVAESTVM